MARNNDVDGIWTGRSDCRSCPIRSKMEFANLPAEAFGDKALPIDVFSFSERSALFRQGRPGDFLFSIRSGWVKLVNVDGDGRVRIVRMMGPGSVLGLNLLAPGGGVYQHDAVAISPVEVCRIPVRTMSGIAREYPSMFEDMLGLYEQHLQCADAVITSFSTGILRERIIRVVRFLAEETAGADERFSLLTGSDFAALVGATEESVSRVLADLKRQGSLRRGENGRYSYVAA